MGFSHCFSKLGGAFTAAALQSPFGLLEEASVCYPIDALGFQVPPFNP